jgi:hypothetical protein
VRVVGHTGEERNAVLPCGVGNLKERDNLKDPGIGVKMIIIKWILKK